MESLKSFVTLKDIQKPNSIALCVWAKNQLRVEISRKNFGFTLEFSMGKDVYHSPDFLGICHLFQTWKTTIILLFFGFGGYCPLAHAGCANYLPLLQKQTVGGAGLVAMSMNNLVFSQNLILRYLFMRFDSATSPTYYNFCKKQGKWRDQLVYFLQFDED